VRPRGLLRWAGRKGRRRVRRICDGAEEFACWSEDLHLMAFTALGDVEVSLLVERQAGWFVKAINQHLRRRR